MLCLVERNEREESGDLFDSKVGRKRRKEKNEWAKISPLLNQSLFRRSATGY